MTTYKVAIIHNTVSPYRVPLFEELASRPSMDLTVYFCSKSHSERGWKLRSGEKFRSVFLPGFTVDLMGIRSYTNPSIVTRLLQRQHDVVIIGGWADITTQAAFFVSKITGIPVILWTGDVVGERNLFRSLFSPLAGFIATHSDSCISYGTRAKNSLMSKGIPGHKIFPAYNTVDTNLFFRYSQELRPVRRNLKDELGITSDDVILYIGQLIDRKGIECLIRAYAMLARQASDVGLVIVGKGKKREELERLVSDLGLSNVHFTGFIPDDRIFKYYAIADVFVLPSSEEVWGLVLNEAMASGLPVISTDMVGASMDLISNGVNGYVYEADSVDGLYQALIKTLPESEKMGNESQRIIMERFTIPHAVESFVQAIEYALSKD